MNEENDLEKTLYIELINDGCTRVKAEKIVKSLKKDAENQGKTLEELLKDAERILYNIDIQMVSAVDRPAQDSQWILLK